MTQRKVIELIRVSTKQQAGDDRASIPAQRVACRKIAEKNQLEIRWTIQIDAVSGASVMYSPEMKQLQQIVKGGECHGIVCKEHTRLLRPEDFGDYALLQVLKEAKVLLYAPDGVIDLTTPTGQFMATVQFGVAGLERNMIRQRMVDAREQMRREGRNCSSPSTWPFAVEWSKEHGWSWTGESEQVVRLFELFTSGTTSYSDLHRLTGIPYYTIPIVLKNPVYTGWRVFDTCRDSSPSGKVLDEGGRLRYTKKLKRAQEDVLRVKIFDTGLVSDAVWTRAQQLVVNKREMRQRSCRTVDDRFLYRGMLKCAGCDDVIYGHAVTEKRAAGKVVFDYYVCRGKVGSVRKFDSDNKAVSWSVKRGSCSERFMRRERLEPIIDQLLSEHLTDERFLGNLLDGHEHAAKQNDNQARIQRVRRELEAVTERRERLADLYIDGKLNKEQHAQRLIKLDQEQKAAQRTLNDLTKDAMPAGVTTDELATLLAPFQEWTSLAKAEKRQLLSTVVPAIKVSDYKVHGIYLALAGERQESHDASTSAGTSGPSRLQGRTKYARTTTAHAGLVHNESRFAMEPIRNWVFKPRRPPCAKKTDLKPVSRKSRRQLRKRRCKRGNSPRRH